MLLGASNRSPAPSNCVSGVPNTEIEIPPPETTGQMRPIDADFSRIPPTETGIGIPKLRKERTYSYTPAVA